MTILSDFPNSQKIFGLQTTTFFYGLILFMEINVYEVTGSGTTTDDEV